MAQLFGLLILLAIFGWLFDFILKCIKSTSSFLSKNLKISNIQSNILTYFLIIVLMSSTFYYFYYAFKEKERYTIMSGDLYVGNWNVNNGGDHFLISKTSYGKILISRTNYSGQQHWILPGSIQDGLLHFGGIYQGVEYKGKLYIKTEGPKSEVIGELHENNKSEIIILEKFNF